jgi:sugar lactone lactonase YvrE
LISSVEVNLMRRAFVTIISALVPLVFLYTEARAHPAWGIAVDNQGQVYFSDLTTVWKIDARGTVTVFRAAADRHIHDLNIDEAGNLYGADNSYEPSTQRFFSAIWKMTPAGGFTYLLPPTVDPPEGISIWKDRDGNSYHATNYPGSELLVLKRGADGNVTVLVGNSSAARQYKQGVPYSLGGMAFGTDGALYFTHGANVSKLATNGTLTQLARNLTKEKTSANQSGGGSATQLLGIAVDAQGNAFVADHGNRRVLKIMPNGQTSTVLQAEESWFPTGVALKGSELYILEIGQTDPYHPLGTRVRRLSPDGKISTLANVVENRASSGNPADGQSPSDDGSGRVAGRGRNILYALIGAGTSIFALIVIVGLMRRKASAR